MVLEKIKISKILHKQEEAIKIRALRHVAITMQGLEVFAQQNRKPVEEIYKKSFEILKDILQQQIKLNIPIITVLLLTEKQKKEEKFSKFIDELIGFFNYIKQEEYIHQNKIKISALGKWYDIPSRAVDPIKEAIAETKDYDTFFLNFCINYEGQAEIVDACKMMARQIKAGKLDVDSITKETIKDNVYSSYFLPPDLLIKTGKRKTTSGILLWDSPNTEIFFTNRDWPEFSKHILMNAVRDYQKG
jgi:undecaprenyl diphosphate synthase